MAKLKPPYINNILTPFTITEKDNDIIVIFSIPFELNRSVHPDEIKKEGSNVKVMIKDAINNDICILDGNISINENNIVNYKVNIEYSIDKAHNKFISGNYYKITIALIDNNNEIGFYSPVGLAKCIQKPQLKFITNNENMVLNAQQYEYTVVCDLLESTEKIAMYKFDLVEKNIKNLQETTTEEKNEKTIFSTGWLTHDTGKDTGIQSYDSLYLTKTLDVTKTYVLKYYMQTINGYEDSVSTYLETYDTVNVSLKNYLLTAEPDTENGTIVVKLVKKNINLPFTPLTCNFVLLRASEEDHYSSWTRLSNLGSENEKGDFELKDALLVGDSMILWEDFTVEHGVSYKYALQAYNSFNFFSNKIQSNLLEILDENGLPQYDETGNILYDSIPTKICFDDMYLSDGVRQLRIQFNPKMSSFKNTILETKLDTIGSQYPFFFRNGIIKYKEFPLSGLISLLMDPQDKFKVGLYNIKTGVGTSQLNGTNTDLTDDNIKNERKFKLEVLDWLTNGQPKIFRSPTEGNYLVRLMNTSLSPNDTLGRMLHTFSCTAYEMDAYTMENLDKYGFINFSLPQYKYASFIGEQSIKVSDCYQQAEPPSIYVPDAFFARIIDSYPIYSEYSLMLKDANDLISITVGGSGIYEIPMYDNMRLQKISWSSTDWEKHKKNYIDHGIDASFKIQYGYYDLSNLTNFHFIKNITTTNNSIQHIGTLNYTDINNIDYDSNNKPLFPPPNLIASWGIREIGTLYHIRLKRRPIIPIYRFNKSLYYNGGCTEQVELTNANARQPLLQALYRVYEVIKDEKNEQILDYQLTNEMLDFNDIVCNDNCTEIIAYYTSVPIEEQEHLYDFMFNNETKTFTMDYAWSSLHSERLIDSDFLGTTFELDTTLLANTPVQNLKINRGLILEMYYKCKNLEYDFTNGQNLSVPFWIQKYKDNVGSSSIQDNEIQAWYEKYEQLIENSTSENWLSNYLDNNQTITRQNYLLEREKYKKYWNDYVTALRMILWYLTKDQEVFIE